MSPVCGPMKVFISQPMNGKSEEQILDVRERAVEDLKKKCNGNVEILDSYFEDYDPKTGCIPLKFLGKSIEILADAQAVYFVRGWSDNRGCRIEHQCAVEYGIPRLYEE